MSLYHCYYDSLRKPHYGETVSAIFTPVPRTFLFTIHRIYKPGRAPLLPFPTVLPAYDPRTIASISNCCKSILCYYLACYLTDETYHVENGIARKQYHYNFERTNTVYDIRGYEVKRKEKKRKGIYSTVVQDRPLLTFEFRTIKGKEQKGNRSDRKPFRVSRELEKSDTTGFAKSKSARWPRSTTIVPSPVSRDFIESA